MNVSCVIKALFFGVLILTGGGFASRDLCQQNNIGGFCRGNLGIGRADMPQVEDSARDAYLWSKSSQGIPISVSRIPSHQLTCIQREISKPIVLSMLRSNAERMFNPCERSILVARNHTHYNIIDGHHTAAACHLLNGNQEAIVVQDFGNRVLKELQGFAGCFRRLFNDAIF